MRFSDFLGKDDTYVPPLNPAFLDCGAHSVDTGVWKELPVEDYTNWVKKHHEHFRLIAVPDIIGNSEITKVNSLKFGKDLDGIVPKRKILPIYHVQAQNMKHFETMLEYADQMGTEWVAIGGALGQGYSPLMKQTALEEIFKRLPRERFKIHLLGITDPHQVAMFLPDSVDSSVIIQHSSRLVRWRYEENLVWRKDHTGHLPEQRQIDLVCEELDRIFPLVKNPPHIELEALKAAMPILGEVKRMMIINGMNLRRFEADIAERAGKPFTHFVTHFPLKFPALIANDMIEYFWSERALFSYAQFHDKTPQSTEKLLSLIKKG